MSETRTNETARRIADAIEHDLRGRSGLKHEWDRVERDIQREIRKTWRKLIVAELGRP